MSIRKFGLIGYPLSHSFSRKYFADKFRNEDISDASYENFPIEDIELLPSLIQDTPELKGLNVTIPYKQDVISHLDELSPAAAEIGAVNTIVVESSGRLSGYNSDIYGFDRSLSELIPDDFSAGALVLGTGGASKAVAYVCRQRGIAYKFVSRKAKKTILAYADIDQDILTDHPLIINTTPLGMHPRLEAAPDIPYKLLGPQNYLYDLIYNPEKTLFLRRGEERGSSIKNGMEMLILQAERSWQIWNEA